MQQDLASIFKDYSVAKLRQYTSRIGDCLDRLSYEQIWARGCDNENAVGNLALHLAGNLRQWIGAGVAGQPDIRVRDREFRARGDVQAAELKERIDGAVDDAIEIIEQLQEESLAETINVQGYDITVLEAVYHVVEHFAQHTAQIIYATKQMTRADLGFYNHLNANTHGQATP